MLVKSKIKKKQIFKNYLFQVHFAAINCWQPGSECRSQYNKVYSWPVLMAYPSHGRGIQYKGIRTSEHMVKFLNNIIHPVIRICDNSEKLHYKALHNVRSIFNFGCTLIWLQLSILLI